MMSQSIDSQSAGRPALIRRAAVPVTITILCGVCLSVVACMLIWRATDREALAEFNRRAGNRYFTLREGMHKQIEALRALRDLYACSNQVDQQEFSRFAGALLSRHRGIRMFARAETTPPGPAGRECSVRLVRVEPNGSHASAAGVDLWQCPNCRKAMQQAARTNTPALTYCPDRAKHLGADFESLLFLPFLRPQTGAESRPASANQPHGYIVAGFELGELLSSIYEGMDMGGIEVAICRPKAVSAATVAYEKNGRVIADASREELDRAMAGVHFTRQIAFADSSVNIVCWPTEQFTQHYSQWLAVLALTAGTATTGLLAAYIWCSASRAAKQQRINVELEQQIIDRRRAEAALRESQRTMATLMGNLPGMAYRCGNDHNWTMEFVSEGAVALTGYRPDELIGNARTSYNNVIVPEDRSMVRRMVQQAIETRRPFQITHRIHTLDGKTKWVWEQGQGVYDDDGRLLALEGFINDISERLAAERALRHERDYAHSLVATAQAIVLVLDKDAGIREINQYGEALLGYPLSELIGKNWFAEFLPPENRQRQLAAFKQGVIDHSIPSSESPIITREGRKVFFSWTTTILDDPEGNPAGILAIGLDVTQQRHLLEQAQSDAELRKVLLSELNHRVKNNLATISSLLYIELTRPTQDKNAFIQSCQRRVDSLSELHAILSERISERVNVNTLIRRVAAATISGSPPPHPLVHVDLPEDGPTITADMASGLAMATSELIANALRHALPKTENPRLRISMHCHDSLCTLEIADNGPGLPPGFDAERDGGTGLSLVWFIAHKQLHGSLDLCHESGEMCVKLTFKCPEFEPPPSP